MTTDITLTAQQQTALDRARRWLDAAPGTVPQVFKIDGYAGTGKTTLAHLLAAHAGPATLAAAFTGKAASVMARKGLPQAQTLHRLIYDPAGEDTSKLDALKEELVRLERIENPGPGLLDRLDAVRRAVSEAEGTRGNLRFILKEESAVSDAPLVILDEMSMCDERLGRDLLSFGTRVLALGDPAQLPPIKGAGFFTRMPADVTLTEVHRQAQGSPILRAATAIREGRALPYGEWETEAGSLAVVRAVTADQALQADMRLCGTNAKRRAINRRHRELLGHDRLPVPCKGERLRCMKNDYTLATMNGTIWEAQEDGEWSLGEADVRLVLRSEDGGPCVSLMADRELFDDDSVRVNSWNSGQFTWGWCLTTHSSQGSEWDHVTVWDDWPGSAESHRQWLYTAATRAAERLVIVR